MLERIARQNRSGGGGEMPTPRYTPGRGERSSRRPERGVLSLACETAVP